MAIALGINALLPNSQIALGKAAIGAVLFVILFVLALWITPEKEE